MSSIASDGAACAARCTRSRRPNCPGLRAFRTRWPAQNDLFRGFAALPEEQRSVMVLVAVEDLSYEEAARVLGVPVGTVMSRLSQGRDRLRCSTTGEVDGDQGRRNAALTRIK